MTTNGYQQPTDNKYFMQEYFQEFLGREGIPEITGYSADCLTMELEPWERMGGRGAYVHFDGRNTFCTTYVAEIPEGGQLKPERAPVRRAHPRRSRPRRHYDRAAQRGRSTPSSGEPAASSAFR